MSASTDATDAAAKRPTALGTFERYLTLWVALCIVAGIALGAVLPGAFHLLGDMQVAQVNIPVAVLIWLMIVPMLLRVDFTAMSQVRARARITASAGNNRRAGKNPATHPGDGRAFTAAAPILMR